MATHSSILAWRIPWTQGAWWATVHRVTKSWTWLKQLSTHAHIAANVSLITTSFTELFSSAHKHSLLLLRRFSRVRFCATPQTAVHQAPPTLGLSRQEHWSGLPFPSPVHEKWNVKVKSLSCVLLLATPWTAAYQVPLSMGFSRQEYWSGVPLYPPKHRLGSSNYKRKSFPWSNNPSSYYPLFSPSSQVLSRMIFSDFPSGPVDGNLPANVGDMGSVPGPGRFHMSRGK